LFVVIVVEAKCHVFDRDISPENVAKERYSSPCGGGSGETYQNL